MADLTNIVVGSTEEIVVAQPINARATRLGFSVTNHAATTIQVRALGVIGGTTQELSNITIAPNGSNGDVVDPMGYSQIQILVTGPATIDVTTQIASDQY